MKKFRELQIKSLIKKLQSIRLEITKFEKECRGRLDISQIDNTEKGLLCEGNLYITEPTPFPVFGAFKEKVYVKLENGALQVLDSQGVCYTAEIKTDKAD